MIDVFASLGEPAPAPVNWTGVPEPPGWKELTGGMSWPPTGAFPPSPPPACALAPGLWPCSPWPPPAPFGWPPGWPWPLPLPPPPGGAALPAPPPAASAPVPAPAPSAAKSEFPWGWVVLGAVGVGAALLLAGGGASVLADNPSAKRVARALVDAEDGSFYLARLEAKAREARAKTGRQREFWGAVLAELERGF